MLGRFQVGRRLTTARFEPSLKIIFQNATAALAYMNNARAFATGDQSFNGPAGAVSALGAFVVIEDAQYNSPSPHTTGTALVVSCDEIALSD